MKVIIADLPKTHNEILFLPLADLHIGDSMADFQHIKGLLDFIEKTPNAYCSLGGDLMNTAIKSSIGDTYGENLTPMEQLKQCVKLFDPIKEKILFILSGNHEDRVYKQDGIDTTCLMANQLGIGDKYSSTTAYMFVKFGNLGIHKHERKKIYTVYQTHGSGGGRKEGGKINRLSDLSQICDADIYITAHTHLPAAFRTNYIRPLNYCNGVEQVERLFVNTASALNYGGYGDKQGYKPSSKEYPIIHMSTKRAWVEV